MTELLTQKEAAKRLGISPRQLRRLADIVTRDVSSGRYPWPKIREEHRAHVEAQRERREAAYGSDAFQDARARRMAALARLSELEVAKTEGSLIPLEDHRDVLVRFCLCLRGAVLALPARAGRVVHLETLPEAAETLRVLSEQLLENALSMIEDEFSDNDGPDLISGHGLDGSPE